MNSRTTLRAFLLCAALFGISSNIFSAGADLGKSIIFYASFDRGPNADIAGGDQQLHHAPKMAFPPAATAGLPASKSVTLEAQGGISGGFLRFHKKTPEMVFYFARGNFPYRAADSSGTVSFWLRLSPDQDLEPGYCDPIQITSKGWDNAAFFVEFSRDEKPREFRLGAYADYEVWNPKKRDWNTIPMSEKPLAPVVRPPFSRDRWTHVVFTFEHFNTGQPNGVAKLFLDGEPRATISPRTQTFTWDMDKALIMLGLSYIGDYDELAVFNRAFSPDEIKTVFARRSVRAFLPR